MTSNATERPLHGCRVLINEDIKDLANELVALFEKHGAREILLKRSATGNTSGALETLIKEGDSFDLIVVDVMLPPDEAALQACDGWRTEREAFVAPIFDLRARLTVGDLPDKERAALEWQLNDLRARQNMFPRKIRSRIDREAGLKILGQWFDAMRIKEGEDWKPHPGILLLTARQQASLPGQFGDLACCTKWITKPAMEEQIMAAVSELLTAVRKK